MVLWEPWASVQDQAAGWLDEDLFDAWVRRAVELSTDEAKERVAALLAGETPMTQRERQRAHVLELVTAVANAYKSIDTPPLADAVYVDLILKAYNPTQDDRLAGTSGSTFNGGEPLAGGRYLRAIWAGVYVPARYVDVFRAWLDDSATPHVESLTTNIEAFRSGPNGGAFRRYGSYAPVRASQTSEGPAADPGPQSPGAESQWQYAHYRYDCGYRLVLGGECGGWDTQIIVPTLWDFELYAAVAMSLAERGARRVLAESRAYCTKRNLLLARAVGLATTQAGAELMGQAEQWLAEAQQAADSTNEQVGNTIAAVGGIVALANPLIGGIITIVGRIIALLPGTVSHGKDAFGREWPAFQTWRISGSATERPHHSVPEPQGFHRAPRGRLHVLVAPQFVETAWLRVDQGEWRPNTWQGEVRVGSHFVEGRSTLHDTQGWGRTVAVRQGVTTTLDALKEWFEAAPATPGDFDDWTPGSPQPQPHPQPARARSRGSKVKAHDKAKGSADLPVEVPPGSGDAGGGGAGGGGAGGGGGGGRGGGGAGGGGGGGGSDAPPTTGTLRVELLGSLPAFAVASVSATSLGAGGVPVEGSGFASVRVEGGSVARELTPGRWRVTWHVERPALWPGTSRPPVRLSHLDTDVDITANHTVTITFEAPPRWGLRIAVASAAVGAAVVVTAVSRWRPGVAAALPANRPE